ncbi:MAG: metal-dependent hydrolase [Acidobacteria bacterium]|nr:metal-dependent hydrolase [Acidobacteriota bacterium]
MEIVSHTIVSLAAARAGWGVEYRRPAVLMIVASAVVDVDRISWLFGHRAYLLARGGITHSILGSLLLALAVAAAYSFAAKGKPRWELNFNAALGTAAAGAAVHLLVDICSNEPIALFWPIRDSRFAFELMGPVDVWMLSILVLGLLLPMLFGLISEEIGAKPTKRGGRRGAIIALALVAVYGLGRWQLQERALQILRSRFYHDMSPRAVGAFPTAVSPLLWRGVVETDNTMEEVEISLKPGAFFDPDRGTTYYKPEDSPALHAARDTRTMQIFLKTCRYPIARVEKLEIGWQVEIRDLKFPFSVSESRGFVAQVVMDNEFRVKEERLLQAYEAFH